MSPVNVQESTSKSLEKLHLSTTDNEQHKIKENNWSGNADNNSSTAQMKFLKNLNNDLYSEAAAQLLELSCTLCDNCRCIDCQSGYFECDDWDSNSDLSIDGMDEYDEPFVWDTSTRFCMQPCDYYYDDITTTTTTNANDSAGIMKQELPHKWHTNSGAQEHNNCMEINCDVADSQCSKDCEYSAIEHGVLSTQSTYHSPLAAAAADAAIALHNNSNNDDDNDDDVINSNAISTDCCTTASNNCMNGDSIGNGKNVSIQHAKQPQNNELENCAHFNELSLLDSQFKFQIQNQTIQPQLLVQ